MEEILYRNTGKQVRNKKSGEIGIVLREFAATGSVQVLERIEPKVICTHDSWETLELVEEEEERELLLNELRLMTSAEDFEKYIADASLQELRELREELV